MSRYIKYTFGPAVSNAVCQVQNVAPGTPMLLNGSLSNSINSEVSFIANGYCRAVSLTSGNDLSGVQFTVKGTQNNKKISETITGPNATTVYGVEIFDVITSITVDANANQVGVGSGLNGFFNLLAIDLEERTMGLDYAITIVNSQNTRDYTVYEMLDDIYSNGYTYSELMAGAAGATQVSDLNPIIANTQNKWSGLKQFFPSKAYLVSINGAAGTADHTTTLRFRQCGN